MRPDIEKILYATDLSQNAAYTFHFAVYLAEKLDAELIILHVVRKMTPDVLITLQTYLDKKDREKIYKDRIIHAIDRIKNRLQLFCEKELEGQPECAKRIASIEVCEGYPDDEILGNAEKFDCDAIVIGSSHTILGGVAKRVLRTSRKPVFVVPIPKAGPDMSLDDD
jgi:nucleotide-binding universal stress UspA family protein